MIKGFNKKKIKREKRERKKRRINQLIARIE